MITIDAGRRHASRHFSFGRLVRWALGCFNSTHPGSCRKSAGFESNFRHLDPAFVAAHRGAVKHIQRSIARRTLFVKHMRRL